MSTNKKMITEITKMVSILGILLVLIGFSGSQSISAADPVTINWGDLSPDLTPDPEFQENDTIGPEDDTYFSGAFAPHEDPYHGLGSSSGGLNGFTSQTFTNLGGSSIDMTVYYSNNNYDGSVLEGPDLYQPGSNPNPDRRVTGEWELRVTRDHIGTRTPTTVVLSFSEAVFMDEFIIGSLSTVSSSHEHAIIRAFATADATGPVIKATGFVNVSNLATCATLLHSQCVDDGPSPTNLLSNVAVDPDLTDAGGDGTYDNVGNAADNGIYHVYGDIAQPTGYGRVNAIYGKPIRSLAVSFFATSTGSLDPFTDTTYTAQWISTIIAPFTFRPQDPTAITLGQASSTEQNSGLFILIGLALIVLGLTSGFAIRQRQLT